MSFKDDIFAKQERRWYIMSFAMSKQDIIDLDRGFVLYKKWHKHEFKIEKSTR